MDNISKGNRSDNIEIFQLDNGLSCYVIDKHSREDYVSVCLSVKAGAASEVKGEYGWFHFLEHLLIYPSLYKKVDQGKWKGKFLAFDYAYTSFYETTFWFHGIDGTGVLLKDSINTVNGILNGCYLTKEAFWCTQRDVLTEYQEFAEKRWFQSCCKQFQNKKISMPIGEKEDILRADYMQLLQRHREYYKTDNAAIIVAVSKNAKKVRAILEEIFAVSSFLYLAWLPRKPLTVSALPQNYMEMAMVARMVELTFQELEWVERVECEVEIFNSDMYLFKLNTKEKSVRQLNSMKNDKEKNFSKQLFSQAKKMVQKQLKEQYDETLAYCHGDEIMDSCKEHFLYGEPIINFDNEYEVFCSHLKDCHYEETKEKFDAVLTQFWEGVGK